jgi:hypothetical protein
MYGMVQGNRQRMCLALAAWRATDIPKTQTRLQLPGASGVVD